MDHDLAVEAACNEFIQHVETTLGQILRAIYKEFCYIYVFRYLVKIFKIFPAMGGGAGT